MARVGLTTERVVSAAAELADADGMSSLTLAALAGRLGVRTPSLYAHVGGLPDLRVRLGVRAARMLRATLAEAAAGRSGGDALRATSAAYRAFVVAHPGLYAALHRDPAGGDPELSAAADDVAEIMFAVMRGYGLEGERAVHAVRAVRAAVHGFVSLQAAGGFGLPASVEETWERMIAMLDRGLLTPG